MITDKVIDLLKNTDLTQLQIANQTGITPAKVALINQEEGIRKIRIDISAYISKPT